VPTPSVDANAADFAIAILAGGTSRRIGHDKLELVKAGRTLLEHVLAGVPQPWPLDVLIVGPKRDLNAPGAIRFVREDPPGGGPLAGIEAAARSTTASVLVVLAGDTPDAGAVVPHLLAALGRSDAAVLVDPIGRTNPLSAAYRLLPLLAGLARMQPTLGRRAKDLLEQFEWTPVAQVDRTIDVDTLDDAERLGFSRHNGPMDDDLDQLRSWTAELATSLGVDIEVDVDGLLLIARDAARAVDRKAAPVTTFLVGYAAALNGGSVEAVQAAREVAAAQAKRWDQPSS